MKKLLYIFLFLFSIINVNAQFDTEHWIAPFADKTGGNGADQYLYLSTNKTTPFKVSIYNNNTLYNTVQISKGSPAKVYISRDLMITSDNTQKFIKSKMGLHLVGEKKFFAHFRFSVNSHAEIITSKGKAGLGNEFYAYTPPNNTTNSNCNSTVGFIASEDNTTVTLDHFNSNVTLSNGEAVGATTVKTITLNKGESYILETIANSGNNLVGLNTLHIKANKAISVTNGDFNLISPNGANNDVYMDQASPIDRLGTEYISLKGNGNLNTNMEIVALIATEDNTKYYVNGSATARVLTKKGDYALIGSSDYVNVSTFIDAYNMYIKSDKKIYVYQMLAGVDAGNNGANSYASGGMNILPQLLCLLPNKIEEFASVNEIGNQSLFNVRLNIITEKGATVKVNGLALPALNGPFPVQGTINWESYMVPNVSGNISIESTKAVTAGISGGNGAVGYGGYFAGFNSNPIISKGGDCDQDNITLEVDDTYDTYQWYKNGAPYTGADAQTYIIKPDGPGYYFVRIIKNGCGTQDSPVYKLMPCTVKSSKSYTIGSCNKILNITPKFTRVTQTVDPASVKITSAPTNGTAIVNTTTGDIVYTLTSSSATTDTFTYTFSGTDPDFPETEIVTTTININHFQPFNSQVFTCSNIHSEGTFDLTSADYSSLNLTAAPEYYLNYDANTGIFSNKITTSLSAYYSGLKTIYVKLIDQYGCVGVSNLELKFYPIPNLNTINYNSTLCDLDFDGNYSLTFSKDVSPSVVNGYQNFNITYYLNSSYTGSPLPDNWSYSVPTRVYVLVDSKNGCTNATGYIDFKIGNKIPVNNYSIAVCDNDLDGKTDIKLDDYNPLISSSSSSTLKYFTTQTDAKNNTNPITNLTQTITQNTTYYIRIEDSANGCPNWSTLTVYFNQPLTSSVLKDKVICPNSTTIMDAGTGFTAYKWSNGATTQTTTYGIGNFYVDLFSNGCVYRQYFKITEAEIPVINSIIVTGNNIAINVSGGNLPYYYSLDGINYQTSNTFTNLQRGLQKVYVQAAERCTPIEKEFLIINLLNAITPNGDGINDTLDYSDLKIKKDVKILIVDRYGNVVLKEENSENYYWDGKQNGRTIPSGTYWYVLEWTEPDTGVRMNYKGWVLLKNRN